jgi:hypothetical protein
MSDWIDPLVIFTAFLFAATLAYAISTFMLLRFEHRKFNFETTPSLYFYTSLTDEGFYLSVYNASKTPCRSIRVDFYLKERKEKANVWIINSILPGQIYHFNQLFTYQEVSGLGNLFVKQSFSGILNPEAITKTQEIDTNNLQGVHNSILDEIPRSQPDTKSY